MRLCCRCCAASKFSSPATRGGSSSGFTNGWCSGKVCVDSKTCHRAAPTGSGDEANMGGLNEANSCLVVDDFPTLSEALAVALRLKGFEALYTTSGREALAQATATRFDVAILDLTMPGMDGIALARRLRELPNGASLPLIALTACEEERDFKRTKRAGFAAHLIKPADLVHIVDTIGRVVRSERIGASRSLRTSRKSA